MRVISTMPTMPTMREWMRRAWGTVSPARRDEELGEELRLHMELAAEEAQRRGAAATDAVRVARTRAGGVPQAMTALRDQRGLPPLTNLVQDIRHALRTLRKAPGFAATTVLTLALGIAATAIVFCAIDAILLRPLAVAAPEELHVVARHGAPRARFDPAFYRSLRESGAVFSDVLGSFTFPVTLADSGGAARARAAFVTPNYFALLGVPPYRGRVFQDEQDSAIAIISHRLWKERFNGRSTIVGESLRIGGRPFVIGGVTPPGFGGLQLDVALDLWMPIAAWQTAVPLTSFRPAVDLVGRLAPGLSPDAATLRVRAEYERWSASATTDAARRNAGPLFLMPAGHGLASAVREEFRAALYLMLGICACLWVITIVNVSGLLTARLRERSREIGLRLALGVTSTRLFMQLLAEVVVLVAGGLLLGFILTAGLIRVIPRWIPSWAGIDIRASGLVIGMAVVTAVFAAVVIALMQAHSIDHRRVLRHLSPDLVTLGTGRRLRLSTFLVSAQIALTLPLIVAASLFAQSLYRLGHVDTGFDRSNLLQISVEPVMVGYSAQRSSAYYAALVERLRAVPGVADASVSSGGALSGFDGIDRARRDGGWQEIKAHAVDDRYFSTMGIRLLSGHAFEPSDVQGKRQVVVLNEALARRLFDGDSPVGQEVTFGRGRASDRRTVVGVVENTADANMRDRSTPTAYLPVSDGALLITHVRTALAAEHVIPEVRRTAMSVDPTVPILAIDTIESRRDKVLQRDWLLAGISAAVAWLALLISAIGVFGRLSHDIATRTREIGIRSALGASRRQIAGLFLADTGRILFFGGVFGIAAALCVSRVMHGLLYEVSPTGSGTYALAVGVMAAVAAVATMLPLDRALRAGAATNLTHD